MNQRENGEFTKARLGIMSLSQCLCENVVEFQMKKFKGK